MSTIISIALAMLLAVCTVKAQSISTGEQPQQQSATQEKASISSPEMMEAERLSNDFLSLFAQGKYDEALPIAKQIVEVREKLYGIEHQLLAVALSNLGVLYIQRKEPAEAKQPLLRALKIYEQQLGADHATTIKVADNLAYVYGTRGDYGKSAELYERVLAAQEKKFGADSPHTAMALLKLGNLAQLKGRSEEARSFYERTLILFEKQPKPLPLNNIKLLESYECLMMKAQDEENVLTLRDRVEQLAIGSFDSSNNKAEGIVTSGKGVINGTAISKPQPSYPHVAKQKRVQGAVHVLVTIDPTGKVAKACAIKGHPLLRDVSERAALMWRFSPTKLEDKPVEVTGTIIFNFTLQ